MRHMLVETTGEFMLIDPNGQVIEAHRPSVVVSTGFVQSRIAIDQVRWLGDVSSSATDADFVQAIQDCDGDILLAVASFLTEPDNRGVPETQEQPKPKRGGRPRKASSNAVSEG